MRIVYCGRLQDIAGKRSAEVAPPADIATVHQLREWLVGGDPGLRQALFDPTVRIVVNDELAAADRPVSGEDEIAFMPPVSGG